MNKKKRNEIFSYASGTVGIIAGIMKIINGADETIAKISSFLGFLPKKLFDRNSDIIQWLKPIGRLSSEILFYIGLYLLLPFACILVIFGILNFSTSKYRKRIGTHGIPCTLFTMYHFKVANYRITGTVPLIIFSCKILGEVKKSLLLTSLKVNSISEISKGDHRDGSTDHFFLQNPW